MEDDTVEIIRSSDEACFLDQSASSPVAIYSSAPISSTSALLLSDREIPTTLSAPMALAKTIPKCPSPPTPRMPTLLPGPQPCLLSGENTVTPPHSIGAANSGRRPSGTLTTKCDAARWYRAYPPCDRPPLKWRMPYVTTIFGQ